MPLDPAQTCFFTPPGLSKFKQDLFNRVAGHIRKKGGQTVEHDEKKLAKLPPEVIPIVGCTPALTPLIAEWRRTGRKWVYWDRGYCRRVFSSWLPKGENGGYYRWHICSYQANKIRNVPDDRWKALNIPLQPWRKNGKHIVIAAPTRTYARFHHTESWIADTIDALSRVTERQLVIRDKESKRPLQWDLEGAHCLVTHGSNTAVESVILGCPTFCHQDSAASLVGMTDLTKIENPVYPDREAWANTLAYSQFSERELVDGTLWRLIT